MTVATARRQPAVRVEACMGTVFTIDIRDPAPAADGDPWRLAIGEVVAWLHHVDAVFSTYQPDSDISRLQRGEVSVAGADPDVGAVLALCARLEQQTNGYFSARYQGQPDPTGVVKGWAIERASQILRHHGSHNHAINGGGDIQIAGEAAPSRPWTIGISDPLDGTRLVTTVTGRDFAVATSGISERGHHIINPRTGQPADELASVTVTGRSLTVVDAYATAAFAMGPAALRWIETLPGHNALIVTRDGTMAAT
ncbi:MAG TPA: FAD:protein FMN transferase, partial [Acidimicrobiales bacterium]|nr:FAD:protein FMN transferase [Acidimicrobiales bacterium]